MKPTSLSHFALLSVVLATYWVGCSTLEESGPSRPVLPETAPEYRTEVAQIFDVVFPTAQEDPLFNQKAQLGRVLFHDRMLSQNGAVSCNSCHLQSHGFAEPKALSSGLRKELTERNASHLANPAQQSAYFWDGRANNLSEQVTMPIENHVEMGFQELSSLVLRMNDLDYYPPLFEAAFGTSDIDVNNIQKALAAFLSSMVTCHSKADEAAAEAMPHFWDPWGVVAGDITLDGLDALEREGFELFHGEAQCANCHGGPHFNGWGLDFADIGLEGASSNSSGTDAGIQGGFIGGWGPTAMKVPSLRNVALTAPYMHDGRFATLDDVLDHYSHGIQDVATLDHRLRDWSFNATGGFPGNIFVEDPLIFPGFSQGQAPPVRMNFSPEERTALKAFLNSLTDYSFIQDERFSNPFTRP
jgi:cytochrome c peroxidase